MSTFNRPANNVMARKRPKETEMKRFMIVLCVVAVVGLASTAAHAAVNWDAFVIRNANSGTTPSIVEDPDGDGVTTTIDLAGEKTGYGTKDFNGRHLSDIISLSYNRIDQGDRFAYFNVWATDGTHYANLALANSPDSGHSNVNGLNWATLNTYVYDTNLGDLTWMLPGAKIGTNGVTLVHADGTPITLAEIGALTINSPSTFDPPIGTGAPKNGDGINIVFGDTQSNFLNAYEIDDVSIDSVPEPATIIIWSLLGGLGVAVAHCRRKRTA
jgi:hypothetical protein